MERKIVFTVDVPEEYLAYFLGGILHGAASRAIDEERQLKTTKIISFAVENPT